MASAIRAYSFRERINLPNGDTAYLVGRGILSEVILRCNAQQGSIKQTAALSRREA